ncbi:MAG: alkanesulfonate monooxygenase SsuD [Candidatus Azotimanducaceae bacterium]|jgi:alkanesulfonate monooxygenase SsuD/methylene tetrahydromethanopterin reductase-like flavin-dependent oxidoreductase (luciferase family)|tara:strand:- start:444 stop:1379 length:936 start_codon:yes stop_codon:yes gene_type:complete
MDLKFGLATPSQLWSLDWTDRQALLKAIDAAGFNHVFLADHVSFRNGAGADGFVETAALAQLHPSLGVMISIYLLPLRHPLPVARQLASMARVAPGRFTFGVGIGGEDPHELEVCGVSPRRRGIRANESLAIIQGLLRGEAVSFSGQAFEIDNAVIRPTPSIPIPILVGGRSDAALTRTARFGDGWIGVWCSVKRYAQAVAKIETEAVLMGRPGMDWCHGYQPWVGVDWQSATTAKAVVKSGMEAFYKIPFEQFERYTPSGTPLEVATQLAPYVQAGCKMFNLKVCAKHPEEEVALGAAVVEHLKGLVAAG